MSRITHRIIIVLSVLFAVHPVIAQELPNRITPPTTTAPMITGSASAKGLRFTAPSTIVQMHLQVYDSAQLLFEVTSEGNVLDWTMQNSGGGQLMPGSYLCVVTVKSLSGKLSQRIGSAVVAEKEIGLQPIDAGQFTAAQQQAVGPVEENSALTILKPGEPGATTVLAHDGQEGQLTRGRGALTFRKGDFYSGTAQEQMRLTAAGNLGIGTDNPQAKLDVAGGVRAREGFLFANGSNLNVNDKGGLVLTNADGSVTPNAAGTGTLNQVAKWAETGGVGTLGDSLISESGGNVVVGNAGQTGNIQIFGTATQDVFAGMGTDIANGPAFNYGYAGSSFGRSAGFFNVRPDAFATAPNPSLRLMTANVQRMIITNTGNVGIGNLAPGARLDVTGNINTSTQFNIGGNRVLSVAGTDNVFVGVGAGQLNFDGSNNSFFGKDAGQLNGDGILDSFFGDHAGASNSSGVGNSFFGANSGFNNTTANANSFFGHGAGFNHLTGDTNSFFGTGAGFHDTMGVANNFFGFDAGTNNTSGRNNTFIGASSGASNTVENNNTFIGKNANGAAGITNATAVGIFASVTQSNSLVLGGINGTNNSTADTNVGIGTTAPNAKLQVAGGDIAITTQANGLILRATDGTKCYRLTVNNAGTLSTTMVTCP